MENIFPSGKNIFLLIKIAEKLLATEFSIKEEYFPL
jgi:hypothetical protein